MKKRRIRFYEYPLMPFKYVFLGIYAPISRIKKAVYVVNHIEKFEGLIPEEPKPKVRVKINKKHPKTNVPAPSGQVVSVVPEKLEVDVKPKPVKTFAKIESLSKEKVTRPVTVIPSKEDLVETLDINVAPVTPITTIDRPTGSSILKDPTKKPKIDDTIPQYDENFIGKSSVQATGAFKEKTVSDVLKDPTKKPVVEVLVPHYAEHDDIPAELLNKKWWQFWVKASVKTLATKTTAKPFDNRRLSDIPATKEANETDAEFEKRRAKGLKEREEFIKANPQEKGKFLREARDLRKKQLAEEKMRLKMQKAADKKSKINARMEAKYQNLKALVIENDDAAMVRSKTKRLYRYLARDIEGRVLRGKFYANAKIEVHSFLMSEGYEVYNIELDSLGFLNSQIGSVRLKMNDIIFFITQLSTYLKAGIPLTDAVRLLSKQADTAAKQTLFQAVVYELTMGANFSQALERQGSSFPKLLINMVKTSELTGGLTEVLDDMEKYYKSTEQTKRQMISAMTYPAIVAAFSLLIIIFIMVYVIPNFVGIYEGASIELPLITKMIVSLSQFMQTYIILIILFMITAVVGVIMGYKYLLPFRATIQYMLMHVPVVKDIIIYNEVTMFTKTFASLLHHDVYITDSMEILGNISNNEIFKYIIHNSVTNLQSGESISLAFKNQWAFPVVAYEMLLTGEKTGELATMMDKVADYYQQMHSNLVTQLKAFIEPILIVTLTLVVGGVLLAVIVPMFNLYSEISTGV